MHYARLAILALSIGVGFVAYAQKPNKTPSADIAAGKELFRQHCSTCHGMDAKGANGTASQGPMAMYDPQSIDPAKRVPPADLTVLREQNSGKFPADRVRNAMYNKDKVPAHGTPEMPAWGNVFYLLKDHPKLLEKRVRDLTGYIQSIQATRSN